MMLPAQAANVSRVLIVEDEALLAEEIRERLTRLNYRVIGVEATGDRAIAAAHEARPDLVLMDIRLRGTMDGIEAASAIQERVDVPIVYLTAHSDHATLQRAKQTAPYGYLLKPVQERDLLVTLEMAMHRHELERRLRQSELRYATTLNSIGDGVIATDVSGRVTFVNAVAAALTGWRPAEAIGRVIHEVFTILAEDSGSPIDGPVWLALQRREVVRPGEAHLLVARDGAAIPIDDSASPIVDDRGEMSGAVVAFRDIRQRRLAEDALRKAEDELRQAQKMEAIGRLAGGVAHDFNNLLTVIMGSSEMLLALPTLDATAIELAQEIHAAGRRSTALTRQLLTFSRRQILQPRVFDLSHLVREMVPILSRILGEDVRIASHLAAGARVEADPGQLEQVLMNLVVNARDAMPGGGDLAIETQALHVESVIVHTRPEMPRGQYVCLTVRDTGTGMDADTKARLFEPFFTTKEQGKGTGLGLATVYGIVRQSGGYVYVYSELGEGTAFRIYLPQASAGAVEASELRASRPVMGGSETVLLVEDEEAVRAVAIAALRQYGYHVLTAANGREAIALSGRHAGPIHLLVTDVVMPGMNGRQLAGVLAGARPGLQVLFVSGYTDDTVLRHGVRDGDVSFLQKPFSAVELARRVREVIDRAQG